MKYIIYISLILTTLSCDEPTANPIQETDEMAYNTYLSNDSRPGYESALEQKEFWSQKMRPDSTGAGTLAPLASSYAALFDKTGDAKYLTIAEELLLKGREISAHNKDGYGHALAKNYISQHRFKEAREILEEVYSQPNNELTTELMLFDVYMELGEYQKADSLLGKVKNNSDFNYLIRLAKWSDYRGDLDSAIKYLEQAKEIADASGKKELKVWTYSNIADYYGHAGRIEDSYNHYMKTLALEPDNAYAKKGIAWIKYSKEKNTTEARRILDSVMVHHKIPDYHLLLAEMAAFEGDEEEEKKQLSLFKEKVQEGSYGAMYNTYLIELYAEENPELALSIANEEVKNRATPETYHLLAYAQLKNNEPEKALRTIEDHVAGKTYEPMAQYHSALVYKANGELAKMSVRKEELLGASYELGPVTAAEIKKL
ncbi:MAG: tetratricopeptide repeat protein [Flavobacteriaceae bacterium]|nr:tetratricopeptide repeat protein [Flavobacteriaceae bacterium]